MSFQVLPLDQLRESPANPRRHWDKFALEDLAASIRTVGILEPLLVRPVNGRHEIVAGGRRFRAAKLVGLTEVPVIVRTLTDQQALEASIIENLQRADVHPLDEADGYRALMAADPAYTPEAIAAKVGKSKSYVYQRLKLADLAPAVKKAFEADRITAGHAILIARLSPADQARALDACFDTLWGDADEKGCISVRELNEWIEEHVRLDVQAPEIAQAFPELAETLANEHAEGRVLLELSRQWTAPKPKKGDPPPPLPAGKWHAISGKKDRCKSVQKGVIVEGNGRAQVLDVCATQGCPKHFPAKSPAERTDRTTAKKQAKGIDRWRQAEEKRQREEKAWQAFRSHVINALVDKTKGLALTGRVVDLTVKHVLNNWTVKPVLKLVKASPATLPQLLVLAAAHQRAWSRKDVEAIARAFGVDVAKLAKAHASAPEPKKPIAARGAKASKAKRRRKGTVQTSARKRAKA